MEKPYISIIIPCPPGKTPDALEHIKKLNYPQEKFEVIIEEGYNPSAQRNRGIKKARGEVIGFTDDDCSMDPNWLDNTMKYFGDKSVGIVGGPNLTPKNSTFLSKCFGFAMSSYFGAASMSTRYDKKSLNRNATEQNLIFNNMFVKNEIFKKGMYLNEALFPNEENEFINRVSKQNYKMIYASDVSVYHPRKSTFKGFVKQVFGYGAGRAHQTKIQPDSFKILYLIPTLFVLGILSLFLSFLFHLKLLTEIIISGFILYFIISIAISLKIAIDEKKPAIFPLMPLIFFMIHISYGMGFMMNFLKLHFNIPKWFRSSSSRLGVSLACPLTMICIEILANNSDLMSNLYS
ncbi:Glycosyltransferase AglI [uncultured archaeon]|nr:Glycosyltransferase AglI [uncultured archaeon]